MKTVLFVGAGRNQRRGIARVQELGARVVAVDVNPDAPGLALADAGEIADFDVDAVADVGRRHSVDGVLTFATDRAVPIVAAVAERLGLPGIGSETAHLATNKIAMRRRFAERGVPQPQFAAVRTLHESHSAARTVGFPAVIKPADSAGQRGLFLVRSEDELAAQMALTIAASPSGEAIVEEFEEGREVNTLLVARDGDVRLVTASDRLRPEGVGFGVGIAHVYPSTLFGDALAEVERVAVAAVRAIGLRDGIAYPQLLVLPHDNVVRVVEIAARIPAGQMDEVPRLGVGVDLVEIALKQALGEPVPDELVAPRFQQPLAVRFLTASPGPLPTGVVESVGPLDKALAFPGVQRIDTWIQPGETIRPVQTDGDRRGYVIAVGETNLEALERAEAAAGLIDVLTR
ncbi:MAG TPA: ATP-grasp domain-containing protein [Gaiellaceae bacterium]|nr:ATP-grasp domain-containing protein [Gaiellaceae bacterium]